jgi:hypothetical protein
MPNQDGDCRLGNPMRPAFPFPVSVKRTGASTNEPSLNMMREMTDGRAKTHSTICPLWLALLNVYPVALPVNPFLRTFEALISC